MYFYLLDYNLILPPWLCQPLIRMLPTNNLIGTETNLETNKSKTDEKEASDILLMYKIICVKLT